MKPTVSIVIVSWNAWHDLDRCLRSIRAMDFRDFEIIVVDNASADGLATKVSKTYPEVRLYRESRNVGHTRAINRGFSLARGQFILILDADTELPRDCVSILVDFLVNNPDVSLVAPRTYYEDGRLQETARNFPSAINGLFGRQTLLSRLFPNNNFTARYLARERVDETEPYQVEQVSASCMMLPRQLVDEVGPWDEGYFGYWVDTDWCMRLKQYGKKVFCVPRASIVHHERNEASRKKSPARIRLFHTGAYRFYRKYHTWGRWDPRALAAAIFLTARAIIHIGLNLLKPSYPAPMDAIDVARSTHRTIRSAESASRAQSSFDEA